MRPSIGLMFVRENLPELAPDYARMIEAAGLDDLWIVEDAFYNGGLSAASVALAVTERITVGIGILPAPVRNAAYTAMDIATLARMFPGRVEIGFGHGVADWIRQVGEFPVSQMAALEEVAEAVRSLLRGDTVNVRGKHVSLDEVRLEYPPAVAPPISLGVTGPKSLALSGRVADGTILVELTGPALIRKDLAIIGAGMVEAGRPENDHRITVFAYWSQDADGNVARQRIKPLLAGRINPEGLRDLVAAGFAEEAKALIDRGGTDLLAAEMPDTWIDEIAVAGTPAECLAAIDRLGEAGAVRVGLVPPVDATIDQIRGWAEALAATRRQSG